MLTKEEMLILAAGQSAIDLGCDKEDFFKDAPVVVLSRKDERARKYLTLPFLCQIVSYGQNPVASVDPAYRETVLSYLNRFRTEHLFETPGLHVLEDAMKDADAQVCFMAEYFLPDPEVLYRQPLPEGLTMRLLTAKDFSDLYLPVWSNALCEKRKELDVLGMGAYTEDGELVGLAGCSADCDTMWQIGIDVLPAYRRRGVASALTAALAEQILIRGKVPFYCAAWSNVASVRNAIRSGFRPAWVEMTMKSRAFVEEMNRGE